jgi:ABC-type transport system substrate-binding protein
VIRGQISPDAALADATSGAADVVIDALPESAYAAFAKQYGVNRKRFVARPTLETDFVALNTARPLFASTSVRRAVNYAVDRPALLRARGAFSGTRTDQILPPGMPGFKDAAIYPLNGPDYKTARRLAGTRKRSARIYVCDTATCLAQGQILAADWSKIGITSTVLPFGALDLSKRLHTPGEPFDAALTGWTPDYADPFDFLDILLNGSDLKSGNGADLGYFDSPEIDKRLDAAAHRAGAARYQAYGKLDIDITRGKAPFVSFGNRNERELVSTRVRSFVYQPTYGLDLAAITLR